MTKPSLRKVTRQVRETHEAYLHPDSGPGAVTLVVDRIGHAYVLPADYDADVGETLSDHYETIGEPGRFDAVAVARRLIAGLP